MNAALLFALMAAPPAEPPPPLAAEMTVRTYSPVGGPKRGEEVFDPVTLPLRKGELVQIQVKLSRPAHAYIVWIDGKGEIDAFHPWDRMDPRPAFTPFPPAKKVSRLRFPPEADRGFPMMGEAGLETLLLLASEKPLPKGAGLAALKKAFPATPLRHEQEVASLVYQNGVWPPKLQRSANRRDDDATRKIDAPLRKLMEEAGKHFDLVQALRFAYKK